jgi:prepilin-type processing-associated H-X9-DG protein
LPRRDTRRAWWSSSIQSSKDLTTQGNALEGAARRDWINASTDYVYLGAGTNLQKLDDPTNTILAHEKFEHARNGKCNVVYADGHVAQAPVAELQELGE